MPRSPWRDAIDGKITVLRGLRSHAGLLSLVAYFREATALANLPEPERLREAHRMALATRGVLAQRVTVAEPYSLTHDIQEAIVRTVNYGSGEVSPLLKQALTRTFHLTDMPSDDGFVWLHDATAIGLPPDASPNLRVAAVLRAIHWARAWQDDRGHYLLGTAPPQEQRVLPGLAMTAFLDGDSLYRVDPSVPDPNVSGVIPWVLPYLMEGDLVATHMEAVCRRYGDNLFDQVTHTFPTLFLQVLVQMMREKILLWGGSGLEREARKAAERAGLNPIVQVVTWRKAEYKYPQGHIPGQIAWSCHWSSRGHTRTLHRGTPDERVIQVAGSIKGDKSKPYKAPNQRVNLVRR